MLRRLLLALSLTVLATSAYAAGSILPTGYLSASGNQIVDNKGNPVRLACTGYIGGGTGNATADMLTIRSQGFNCLRIDYYDATFSFTELDGWVNAATAQGLKVILDHHGNEGVNNNCLSQQQNGLWYDKNSTAPYTVTDGTDGCGTTGTVTYQTFKANWVSIATHYAGNSTVIGFDLDNEPLAYGSNVTTQTNWAGFGADGATYTAGNGADILAMFNDVGAAIEAADPGVLIMCEGVLNFGYLMNQTPNPMSSGAVEDLTRAHTNPVTAAAGKVVYSVHDYPNAISGVVPDSGPSVVSARNMLWGYLVTNAYAPVWVGEMGASLDGVGQDSNTPALLAGEQAWASDLTSYLNGGQSTIGGPAFTGNQQPIGMTWWAFGGLGCTGCIPDGTLNTDGTINTYQQAVYSQLLYTPTVPAFSTWNPNDKTATINLTNGNLTATSTATAGQGVRSLTSKASGKWCAQVTQVAVTNNSVVGVSNGSENLAGYLGGSGSLGIGLYTQYSGGQIYANGTALSTGTVDGANGNVVTIAIDATNLLVWFSDTAMTAGGFAWNNSTTANPATGVGGVSLAGIPGPYYVEMNTQDTGTIDTVSFTPTGCPSGFATWDASVTGSGPFFIILE